MVVLVVFGIVVVSIDIIGIIVVGIWGIVGEWKSVHGTDAKGERG